MRACFPRTHPLQVEANNSNPELGRTGSNRHSTGENGTPCGAPNKNHDTGSTDDPSSEDDDDEERPLSQEGRETADCPVNDMKSNVTEPDFACSRSNSRSSQTKPGRAKPRDTCENRILVPSAKILHAAFTSRSTAQPQTGHAYTRSDNVSLSAPRKRCPHS